ncbi:NHL repeat-containing protein, partial [bacterium]|nr:NHL repeat-containing protein [bacterium]
MNKLVYLLIFISSSIYSQISVSTFNNAGGDNLWSNAANWSDGIPNVDTAKVTVYSDLTVDSSVTVAQIKMSNNNDSDDSVTITATNSSVLTVTGAGVTQPIQNNNTGGSFIFDLPVVFDSAGETETLRLNSGGDQQVTFLSSLTLNDELTVSGKNKLHDLNINGSLLGAGNLKFGNKVQANFGASYDGSSHTGDIIVAGTGTDNDNLITSNVSADGTLLASGNQIDVQGAGAKIIVNGANTLKGNITIGDNDPTLTVNANQSAIGTITMGAGTLNLVLAADVTSAAFVDNSSADWGTGSLVITGAGDNEVSFGTSAAGITAAQLAQITISGGRATINSSGQININLPSVSSITVDKTSIDENGGVAVITATISAVQSKDVTIPLTITGTATIDTDYSTAFASKGYSTVAGGNGVGSDLNKFNSPFDFAIDSLDNIYVADYNRIMKWSPGSKLGTEILSQATATTGIYLDKSLNIYVSDGGGSFNKNERVLKLNYSNGSYSSGSVVAGGNNNGSGLNQLWSPTFIIVDQEDNIYIPDSWNNRVMKWKLGDLEGVVVAGGNNGGNASNQIKEPYGISLDNLGNLYIADKGNHRIMKWIPGASEGVVVAGGNGFGSALNQLYNPNDVIIDDFGNLYIADTGNHRVVKWNLNSKEGVLVAGGNGNGNNENQFSYPYSISFDKYNNILILDRDNARVQKFKIYPEITILAGSTTGSITLSGIDDSTYELDETIIVTPSTSPTNATSSISEASTITITDDDDPPVVTLALSANSIEENSSTDVTLTATLSEVSEINVEIPYTLSGTAESSEYTITDSPITIAAGATTGTVTISTNGKDDTDVEVTETIILTFGTLTNATTSTTDVTLNLTDNDLPSVSSIAVDKTDIGENGGVAVITATISDVQSKDVTIPLTITGTATIDTDYSTAFSSKATFTVAGGNGDGNAFNQLDFSNNLVTGGGEIEVDSSGNVYVADTKNHRVIKWVPGSTEGIVVAGGNGAGSDLNQLNNPTDIHVDNDGNLYVLDTKNNRIVIWSSNSSQGVLRVDKNSDWAYTSGSPFDTFVAFDVDSSGNIYTADWDSYGSNIQFWSDSNNPSSSSSILRIDNQVSTIEIDLNDNLFAIANGSYLYKIHKDQEYYLELLKNFFPPPYSYGSIRDLQIKPDGNFVLYNLGSDIFNYSINDDSLSVFQNNIVASDIKIDNKGDLYY